MGKSALCLQRHATVTHSTRLHGHRIGKLHSETEKSIASKVFAAKHSTRHLVARGGDHVVFYQEACRYWAESAGGVAILFQKRRGSCSRRTDEIFSATDENAAAFWGCLLNSSLFYWYYSLFSDCEHVNDDLVKNGTNSQ